LQAFSAVLKCIVKGESNSPLACKSIAFFAPLQRLSLHSVQHSEAPMSSTFWKSLAQIAQGQLFNGGHLSPSAVAQIAAARSGANDSTCQRPSTRHDHLPWPRLAIPH
jgi:hypothetical protein